MASDTMNPSVKFQDAPVESSRPSLTVLWTVFNTRETACRTIRGSNVPHEGEANELAVAAWKELTSEERMTLQIQSQMLQQICGDKTALRSFWKHFYASRNHDGHSACQIDEHKFQICYDEWVSNYYAVQHEPGSAVPQDHAAHSAQQIFASSSTNVVNSGSTESREAQHGKDSVTAETLELQKQQKEGMDLLSSIQQIIALSKSKDADRWQGDILAAQNENFRPRILVGVVGGSGHGKSSIINALLNEEKLVPTGGWRACTAVATEVSYNTQTDTMYRAEVVFIDGDEWEAELNALSADITASGCSAPDLRNSKGQAGVAFDKVAAVYPSLHEMQDLQILSVPDLMGRANVRSLLGTSRFFKARTSAALYTRLKEYIDSVEKMGTDPGSEEELPPAIWPLIKVVKIFSPSQLLKDGVTIVDLPGLQDSNRARSNVAAEYMKKCSVLWIVARIIRAVDNKSAKDLLEASFKRQLAMDGSFSSVSFICSMTDHIKLSEIEESLKLDMTAFEHRRQEARNLILEFEPLKVSSKLALQTTKDAIRNMKHDIKQYETFRVQLAAGATIFEPVPISGQSRQSNRDHGTETMCADDAKNDSDDESFVITLGKHLTQEAVAEKLGSLHRDLDVVKEKQLRLEKEVQELRGVIEGAHKDIQDIDYEKWRFCVAARNTRSSNVLRQDYAAEVRALDEQLAMEADPDSFDPSVIARDYKKLAKDLPVFCVSAQGYQRLHSKKKNDDISDRFSSEEQTGMPALRRHCAELTMRAQQDEHKRFLHRLSVLTTSIELWALGNKLGRVLSPTEIQRESKYFSARLVDLRKNLEEADDETWTTISSSLKVRIMDKLPRAVCRAAGRARNTAIEWRELAWNTYRAICHGRGTFTDWKKVEHHFNRYLADPMVNAIAAEWSIAFNQDIPAALAQNSERTKFEVNKIHEDLVGRAKALQRSPEALKLLEAKLRARAALIDRRSRETEWHMSIEQREVNRDFEPSIENALTRAYEEAANHKGSGVFKKMQVTMEREINANSDSIFETAQENITNKLQGLEVSGREITTKHIDTLCADIRVDYATMFVNSNASMKPVDTQLRQSILSVLNPRIGGQGYTQLLPKKRQAEDAQVSMPETKRFVA